MSTMEMDVTSTFMTNASMNKRTKELTKPTSQRFDNQQFRERPIRKGPESPRDYGLQATSSSKEKTKLLSTLNRINNQRTSAPAHHESTSSVSVCDIGQKYGYRDVRQEIYEGGVFGKMLRTTPTWKTRQYTS